MGMFTPTITGTQLLAALQDDGVKNVGSTTRPIFIFDPAFMNAKKTSGALTILQEADTNQYRGWVYRASGTCAVGDAWGLGTVYIPVTGTYTAYTIGETSSGDAIIDILLNGVSKVSLDYYTAGTVNNAVLTGSMGSITKGFYDVSQRCSGKNASSSAYAWRFSSLGIVKT